MKTYFFAFFPIHQPFNSVKSLGDVHSKVEGKFNPRIGTSWNRAMDEARIERLLARHNEDTLLVIIRDWPASEKYKDKPELVVSLEYLVCVIGGNYY